MYITLTSLKKTLGKYIELSDLFIGLPSLIIFIILFSIPFTRLISLIFLSVVVFLLIPINLSKMQLTKVIIFLIDNF